MIKTSDAPSIWPWWQYDNSDTKAIRSATLEFCGIKPVRITRVGRVKYLNQKQRSDDIDKLARKMLS